MRTLPDSESGDVLPISQYNSRVLWSKCFLVFRTCSFHVSRLSKCKPRYLIVSVRGMIELFMYTVGQVFLRSVNVICADLVSLILSLHFLVQRSILLRWSWRFLEAITGSVWIASTAVSSANVNSVFWRCSTEGTEVKTCNYRSQKHWTLSRREPRTSHISVALQLWLPAWYSYRLVCGLYTDLNLLNWS